MWSRIRHPILVAGDAVDWIDRHFNVPPRRRTKGVLAFGALALVALLVGVAIAMLPGGWILEIVIAAVLLAQKSLTQHVGAVADALRQGLPEARLSVGHIVGRDTAEMTEDGVARAAVESAAENLSDAVVAPVFWFLVLGLPGLLLYKITNTADSMIGYRTPRHDRFGWAAARFDDLMNWIPARITALLLMATHWRRLREGDWDTVEGDIWIPLRRDAHLHRSPNAGWPEAAMARILGVSLAGPRSYHGEEQVYPFVNAEAPAPGPEDVEAAVSALWRVWWVCVAFTALLALIL